MVAHPPVTPHGRQYRAVRGCAVILEWNRADQTWRKPRPDKPLKACVVELLDASARGEWCPTVAQEKLLNAAKDWAAVSTTQANQIRAMYAVAFGEIRMHGEDMMPTQEAQS
jgi:hypothetical protein